MQWDPEDYAKNSGAQLGWARELIQNFNFKGHEALLDVGCGDGKVTAELAKAVPDGFVLGVDNSQAFIDYAQRHYPPTSCPNLRFEQMDARHLSSHRQFDLIFSSATLHWVDDHRAFLGGSAKLLKTHGSLVITCGGAGTATDILSILDHLIRSPQWTNYFNGFTFPYYFYSPKEYAQWLPEAGFHPIRVELVEKDMVHQGREGLVAWIRTTWMPYTHRLPETLREQFIQECVNGYLNLQPLDLAGRSHVRMVRLEVEAYIQERRNNTLEPDAA